MKNSTKLVTLIVVLTFTALSSDTLARVNSGSTSVQSARLSAVSKAESAWYAALMSADGRKLKQILTDDFAYQHPSGNTYTKNEIVDTFVSKRITVTKIGSVSLTYRDYGSTVIAYGSNPIEGMLDGKPYQGNIRFVDVWRRVGQHWQLAHRNSQILN